MLFLDKLYDVTLLLCSFIGFFCLKHSYTKTKATGFYTLPFFILVVFFIEKWLGYLGNKGIPNTWLYNYFSTLQFCYYMWLISKMYIIKKAVTISLYLNCFYLIIALSNIIFYQGKTGFHTITYGIGSLLVILSCTYYFYQLLLFPNQESLLKLPQFWVCVALLFSQTCGFPIFCLNNIYYNKVAEEIWGIITIVNYIINIIFYTLFIIAFLCKVNIKKILFHK